LAHRIAIIQGHPDPAGHHLLHAMADAYAEGAAAAGHEVRRIEVAKLEFPLLRTQTEFETGTVSRSNARIVSLIEINLRQFRFVVTLTRVRAC
jgi:putative NADPH-quinone reductase